MCNGLVEKHYKIEAECGDSDLTLVTASIPELGFHIFTLSPWRLMLVLPENGLIIWPAWLTLVFFFFLYHREKKLLLNSWRDLSYVGQSTLSLDVIAY